MDDAVAAAEFMLNRLRQSLEILIAGAGKVERGDCGWRSAGGDDGVVGILQLGTAASATALPKP